MRRFSVVVIVPSLRAAGPVKGALALCNGLAQRTDVTLVVLKPGEGKGLHIDPGVEVVTLSGVKSWREKRAHIVRLLSQAGGRERVVSVSMCLSPDLMNATLSRFARTICSVRGNLITNYRYDYGPVGVAVALAHYALLRRFDRVTAMSQAMKAHLARFMVPNVVAIGNFVDEARLAPLCAERRQRTASVRFVCVANLTLRKRPDLLLESVSAVRAQGVDCHLDIVGDGPLRNLLERRVLESRMGQTVRLHGHLSSPYEILRQADYMVLPSTSEGISRAMLEALYLGVPCIAREVDGNRELIEPGVNGELFREDVDLAPLLLRASRNRSERALEPGELIPPEFRQDVAVSKYLSLAEELL